MGQLRDTLKDAIAQVWEALGPGHSEAVYQAALKIELDFSIDVIHLSSGGVLSISYKGYKVGHCVLDLTFETETGNLCILELKATKALRDDDALQLARYMRLAPSVGGTVGYLINFGGLEPELKQVVSV